jgi:hypothetical protein
MACWVPLLASRRKSESGSVVTGVKPGQTAADWVLPNENLGRSFFRDEIGATAIEEYEEKRKLLGR